MSKFLTDTLAKMSQTNFAYSFVSEHSSIFILSRNLHFVVALTSLTPPSCLAFMQVFFTRININALKIEKPEMDDFEEKKMDPLAKISQNSCIFL